MTATGQNLHLKIVEALVSITGARNVQVGAPGSYIIVSPADTGGVSEVLALATKHQIRVAAHGDNRERLASWSDTPRIHLSLDRLNRVIEHPWQDLTCTVQAGCIWSSLQASLARHRQFVALDPIFAGQSTVGGILASDDSGALRHRYGSLRDLVIGMTLVLSDGTIARTGGKVVKNVAGYDLCKLMTGSLGTLAVITEANFRLHPLPRHTRNYTLAASEAIQLAPMLASVRSSHLLTQAIQIRGKAGQFDLDIQLNAHGESKQEATLLRMSESEGLTLSEASELVWSAREALFQEGSTILRIGTLPAQVAPYIDHMFRGGGRIDIQSVSQAIGLHHVALTGQPKEVAAMIHDLRQAAEMSESNVSVLRSADDLTVDNIQVSAATWKLSKAVKDHFDPDNILNPDAFFVGA